MTTSRWGLRPGPVLMVLAGLSFTVMIGLVKVARAELTAVEVVMWRSLFAIPVAAVVAWRTSGWRLENKGLFLLRAGLGFGAMLCFFTAALGLPVTDLSLITKLQPMVVAGLAALLLGASERSARIWGLLAAGLLGCGILLAPTVGWDAARDWTAQWQYGLIALAATGFSGGAHVCLRVLGRTDASATIVFWFQLVVLAMAVPATLVVVGIPRMPTGSEWAFLAGIGLFASIGQLLMTRAYALDRAAPVAAASYTSPLFAVAGDALFFGTLPSANAYLGGAIVVGAGLWLVLRRGPEPPVAPSTPHA